MRFSSPVNCFWLAESVYNYSDAKRSVEWPELANDRRFNSHRAAGTGFFENLSTWIFFLKSSLIL